MNDENVAAGLAAAVVLFCLTVLGLVAVARWFAVLALVGLVVVGVAVWAGLGAWRAWLAGDRHRLGTRVAAQRAELAHRRAEALLMLELDQAAHDHGRARVTVGRLQDAADQQLLSMLDVDAAARVQGR